MSIVRIPRGAVANEFDCDIVVSEFELLSRYYFYIRINTLEKGMNTFIPQEMS